MFWGFRGLGFRGLGKKGNFDHEAFLLIVKVKVSRALHTPRTYKAFLVGT